jgi:competence protein ComEC
MSRPELTVWKQAPFTRLIFPLMAGIAVAWYFPFKNLLSPQALIISFLPFLTILLVIRSKKFSYKKYGNVLAFLIVFLLGFLLNLLNDTSLRNDFAEKFLNKKSFIALRLKEPLVEKPRSWKTEAEILWISNDSLEHKLRKASGNALLYFQKTDHMPPLQYGDVVLIPNNLQSIQNSGNPGAFDYIRYCHFQNIYFQAYLPKNSWEKLPYKKADPVIAFLLRCRNWCVNVL